MPDAAGEGEAGVAVPLRRVAQAAPRNRVQASAGVVEQPSLDASHRDASRAPSSAPGSYCMATSRAKSGERAWADVAVNGETPQGRRFAPSHSFGCTWPRSRGVLDLLGRRDGSGSSGLIGRHEAGTVRDAVGVGRAGTGTPQRRLDLLLVLLAGALDEEVARVEVSNILLSSFLVGTLLMCTESQSAAGAGVCCVWGEMPMFLRSSGEKRSRTRFEPRDELVEHVLVGSRDLARVRFLFGSRPSVEAIEEADGDGGEALADVLPTSIARR